ncbi:hypothetical protein ACFX5E_02740 [Flavobacterium sp. LS2P90]|uniref:SDR family NAD(P)-dependent oxidoreductase n=1 Tax=Flavobacterium xylosi TaxID=3230415 RepID=A0ABW6HSM0_9FLAO
MTGASSGIGEALAYELAHRNCKLILLACNIKALESVKFYNSQVFSSNKKNK